MDLYNELNQLETEEEKYELLIEIGSNLPKLLETQKNNENRIVGCQNRVWLHFEIKDNIVIIQGESDSRLVSGLLAIVLDIYSLKTKQEILLVGDKWLNEQNINLSITRQKGLDSIVKRILKIANI